MVCQNKLVAMAQMDFQKRIQIGIMTMDKGSRMSMIGVVRRLEIQQQMIVAPAALRAPVIPAFHEVLK